MTRTSNGRPDSGIGTRNAAPSAVSAPLTLTPPASTRMSENVSPALLDADTAALIPPVTVWPATLTDALVFNRPAPSEPSTRTPSVRARSSKVTRASAVAERAATVVKSVEAVVVTCDRCTAMDATFRVRPAPVERDVVAR